MLTDSQIDRYARHILLREVGGIGQERILAAEVRIDGLGPVGEWAAIYLALAGVGRLVLRDPQPVHPQLAGPVFGNAAVGRRRDEVLAEAIGLWNPDTNATVAEPADAPPTATVLHAAAGGIAVAAGGKRAAIGPAASCAACLASLVGTDTPDPAAAALAGSMAAGETLQLLLGIGSRPQGLRLFERGRPLPVPPCVHG